MARWLVRLEGALFDLEELPRWFPDGHLFAVREGVGIYLTGPALEAQASAGDVVRIARQSLDELSAVIGLLTPNYERPKIDTSVIREDDHGNRKTHHVLEAEPLRIRTKVTADLFVHGQAASTATQAQDLLSASKRSPHLTSALAQWSRSDASWPQLYVALEEVELALGVTCDAAGLCSSAQRSRFTSTANNGEVGGRDARHASGKFTPPGKPMTLGQARQFVREILEGALRR